MICRQSLPCYCTRCYRDRRTHLRHLALHVSGLEDERAKSSQVSTFGSWPPCVWGDTMDEQQNPDLPTPPHRRDGRALYSYFTSTLCWRIWRSVTLFRSLSHSPSLLAPPCATLFNGRVPWASPSDLEALAPSNTAGSFLMVG